MAPLSAVPEENNFPDGLTLGTIDIQMKVSKRCPLALPRRVDAWISGFFDA